MSSVRVRPAEGGDAEVLAGIAFRAWETGILPLLAERPGMRDGEKRRLGQVVVQSLPLILVAEAGGTVIGWCSRSARRAYIPYLFVVPEWQSRGVGALLLSRMEAMLEFRGATRVQLETPADHLRAVRFYERQGYRILAMRPDGRSTHQALMSVHLEKQLHPWTGPVDDE